MNVIKLDEHPEMRYVQIPYPDTFPRLYGIHSTNTLDNAIRTRVSMDDRRFLEEECDHLGISVSMLLRWCALHVARVIRANRTGTLRSIDP